MATMATFFAVHILEVQMSVSRLSLVLVSGIALALAACAQSPSPSAPSGAAVVGAGQSASEQGTPDQATATTHGEDLTAVLGFGSGTVNVTPTAAVSGSFSAQINVNVHGAPPNTTFYVQRAPEIGRPLSSDGICQRALHLDPWITPPAPSFVTFAQPGGGPLFTLRTSPGGAGAAHLDFRVPTILDGTRFDVMFRLVDDLLNPVSELRTGCFTVDVK
jgi:hypothetical protein